MLTYALVVFAIGAMGGLVLASFVLRGKLAPWAVSLLHALLGASGLALLTVGLLQGDGGTRAMVALCLLVLAAIGGFFLAGYFHARDRVALKSAVFIHASLAIVGFLTLLVAVYG